MSTDIETAFHTSLDRLLRGEATLDACVATYPEHEERLRDMLVVALDLQALAPLPLDRQAVDRGARLVDDELQRLRARIDRQPEPASAWERLAWWFPRFMPVRMAGLAAAFAIALIAYGGVTLAAVNSGPDSALYGYRLTLEELRIGFASDQEKAYLYLDTAEQRLREIESAAGTGDAVAVARASSAYQEVVRKGVDVLDAVARETQPGAERTGEVAANYRRRLAEHDTRFNSLTHSAAEAQRAPITQARSLAQAGLQDVHSGPILLAAPTATPGPKPSPTAAAPAPVSSPSPTPAALPTPPLSPTPTPTAPTPTPSAETTPQPTATATPAPAVDIAGAAVVVTGDLQAVTDEDLVVAGISIGRGAVATLAGVPLAVRVRAEAIVASDGTLTLVGIAAVPPSPDTSQDGAESQPTAAPGPEPTPTDEPPPEATPTATPTEGEPTATPVTSPTPTASEGAPTATPDTTPGQEATPGETSPAPTPTDSQTSPTPDASSTPESTPTDGAAPTPEASPTPADPTPAPPAADGAPSPTPEATPGPETPPANGAPTPTGEAQATPEPPATPTPGEGEPTPAPEATSTPDSTPPQAPPSPTPSEAGSTPSPQATASPEPTPTETPTTPQSTLTPEVEPPVAPLPPTLQGVLVAIDAFTVRAGGIVFSRPLDTPLVLHGPMAPGDEVLVTFEALRAASSYVLVARQVAPASPPGGPVVTRWQGFVSDVGADALTLNGVRVQVPPEAREDEVWAGLEAGALVEVELSDPAAAEPVASAVRLLGSGATQSFSNKTAAPFG